MKVIEIAHPGAPDVLRFADRPMLVPRSDELLIRVRASGLNHADLAQRAGRYRLPLGTTDIPGLEVAGEVAQVGDDVEGWKVGDAVCALLVGGGYAEYAVAPAVQCLPLPAGLDMAQAAVLPEAFATVWMNVFQKAALQPGERLLIHGGSSGVGIAAIQLASALGSEVYCTAGTEDKCRQCEAQGATRAIHYRTEDFEAVLRADGQARMDVVLDMVGGGYFTKNVSVLARDGRMVYISALGGASVTLDLIDMMRKRLSIMGSVLRPLRPAAKGAVLADMARIVWPFLESRTFAPLIFKRFASSDVVAAHSLMQAHEHIGKLVLTWD